MLFASLCRLIFYWRDPNLNSAMSYSEAFTVC